MLESGPDIRIRPGTYWKANMITGSNSRALYSDANEQSISWNLLIGCVRTPLQNKRRLLGEIPLEAVSWFCGIRARPLVMAKNSPNDGLSPLRENWPDEISPAGTAELSPGRSPG
jgi:hypothetical protein